MTRKRKILISGLVVLVLIVIAAALFIHRNVAINTPFSSLGNGIFSVVFDKKQVLGADRVVLREGDKTLTITEPAQVRDIADDFLVANSEGLCGYNNDRLIYIYNGDELVRQIHWNDHDNLAVVYREDSAHWIYPYSEGQVTLSKEDAQKYTNLYATLK